MADISKITLPSGNSYDIKDAVARQAIAGGVSFIVAWNGSSTPVVANIPAGVVVTYNETDYTGSLAADSAQAGAFYLVHSSSTSNDVYDEYVAVGTAGSKTWERLGSSTIDLSDLGALAYKDTVTASASAVTFSGGTTDKVLGSDATFTTTVTPTTSKLVTTTVPNVTSAGSASSWSFTLGTGDDAETLIISGANGSAPTLGTAKTVATGALDANGGGSSVATGITSASTTTNSKDEVTAVTGIGTGTAAAQTLTIS
jgi:hypothetical protein